MFSFTQLPTLFYRRSVLFQTGKKREPPFSEPMPVPLKYRTMSGLAGLQWAVELQSLAQAGIFYGKDAFDRERYERIREIAAEMISYKTDIPKNKVKNLFCSEIGY